MRRHVGAVWAVGLALVGRPVARADETLPEAPASVDGTSSEPAGDAPAADEATFDDVGFGSLDESPVEPTSGARRSRVDVRLRLDSGTFTERLGGEGFAKLRLTAVPRLTHRASPGRVDLRVELGVRAEADAAYLDPRPDYDDATVETYAYLIRPADSLVRLAVRRVTLTVGFQRVALGVGEATLGVDQVQPRDAREPGLTPLEDGPASALATRLSIAHRSLRVDLVASHEGLFRLVPPPLGTFSPIRAALLADETLATLGVRDALLAADVAWSHRGDGFGRAAQGALARFAIDRPHATVGLVGGVMPDPLGVAVLDASVDLGAAQVRVPLHHRRFGMVGLTASVVVGRVAAFGELVTDLERPVNVLARGVLSTERRHALRGLVGARLTDRAGGTTTLEYAQGTAAPLGGDGDAPLVPTYAPVLVARHTRTFLRDRLALSALAAATGVRLRGGGFARAELSYELRDGLHVGAGYAVYLPTDEPSSLRGFDRHDRLLASIRWDHGRDFGRRE